MQKITTLFCDVGGVILTNGWDHSSRKDGAQEFNFNFDDFEARHAVVEEDFETGKIDLDEYMKKVLFFEPRPFTKDEFKEFIFSCSKPHTPALEIIKRLKDSKQYQMATINNESLDLNLYRISKFHLRDYFSSFFSSSFLGLRKPRMPIYDKVLQITQREARECLFIDDRKENLEQPAALGMPVIHFKDADQLRRELHLRLKA